MASGCLYLPFIYSFSTKFKHLCCVRTHGTVPTFIIVQVAAAVCNIFISYGILSYDKKKLHPFHLLQRIKQANCFCNFLYVKRLILSSHFLCLVHTAHCTRNTVVYSVYDTLISNPHTVRHGSSRLAQNITIYVKSAAVTLM